MTSLDRRSERAIPVAWAGFLLIGWTGVLLPSLVRQVQSRYGIDDAAIGVAFLLTAITYASASFAGGFLTERLGRRLVLVLALVLAAAGLVLEAAATDWVLFVGGSALLGFGSGGIDGGLNALVLDVAAAGRGRALNLLHLFFSIGAFVAPVAIGRLVSAGVAWQAILAVTAAVTVPLAIALLLIPMPSGRRADAAREADVDAPGGAETSSVKVGPRPLVFLGIAIAAYVAAEIGVSNWLVRFLDRADLDTATLALSGFWGGLALGRIVAARFADRFSHIRLTATAGVAAGIAVIVAVLAPPVELSIGAFAIAGFCFGPIFPMIIAIGGETYPDRPATVAGTLTALAIAGSIVYPPLIGLMSSSFGIGTGILGGAVLSFVSATAVVLSRTRRA